ncbi:MAG: insulinase family protein [Bacteroidota bacterium]
MTRVLLSILLVTAMVLTGVAQPQMSEMDVPFDGNTIVGKLDNGLTYYIKKNQKPENFAEVRLAVNAGSILETDAQQGLAHFVEHMCFNGTESFPGNTVVDYLQSIGSAFGSHVNAYTSFDETVYMLRIPTDQSDQFEKGLQIMKEWAHLVKFTDEEIDKERGVIMEEWRTGQGPNERMSKVTYPTLFYKSRYAERLPIGKTEIITGFEYETIRDFYRSWYRPDNMALIIVGDFDLEKTEAMVKEKFGKIPTAEGKLDRPVFEMPDNKELLVATAQDKEAPYNILQFQYKHDPISVKTIGDYRQSIVRRLATSMVQDRINEISKEPNTPFSFSGTNYSSITRAKDSYSHFAVFPEGRAIDAIKAFVVEDRKASEFGFTQSELDRNKTALISGLERRFNEKDKTNSRQIVMNYVYHFLENSPAPGIENQLDLHKKLLPTITLEEVNTTFKSFIRDENMVVTITGIEKEGNDFPEKAEILEAIEEARALKIEAYTDNVASGPMMTETPEAGTVVSTQTMDNIGVTELTLSNGVKVVLKPTTFKNDQVMFRAFSKGGASLYDSDTDIMNSGFATTLVGQSGIGNFDNVQLGKYMSDKQMGISASLGEYSEGMSGSFAPKDIETFFQTLHLRFTQPKIEDKIFQSTMLRIMTLYSNLLNLPEQWFANEANNFLYDNNLRMKQINSQEELKMVDQNRALEIYKERFADADDFTFFFVGNFDVESIKPYLETYLASLPSKPESENFKDTGVRAKQGQITKNFYKGQEPKALVRLSFRGKMKWEGKERTHIQTLGRSLRIMLVESLREEKGGVYSPSANASYSAEPTPTYSINANFYCAPENVEDLIQTVFKDVESLKKNGPSEEILQKVKENRKKSYQIGLEDNGYWMSNLVFAYQYDLNPDRILETGDAIESLTVKSVKKAAKKYFKDKDLVRLVLLPETK